MPWTTSLALLAGSLIYASVLPAWVSKVLLRWIA